MAANAQARLVAVDWGTSSLRGALLDADGRVLDEVSAPRGILTVQPGEFATVFEAHFARWARTSATLCLISGMAGSRQGWQEAPYCPCPAGFAEIAARLAWLPVPDMAQPVALVPGLCCEHPGQGQSRPDVMRGEEVQIFGAMRLLGLQDGTFVLPGTHSKWADVADGRVLQFRTYMTGEFYALLSQHSLLARTLQADAPFDPAAFDQGVQVAAGAEGLLHLAFSTRTLALFERQGPAAAASYLSGLLIGDELRARQLGAGGEVVLIGSGALTARYAQALAVWGVRVRSLGAEATWAGLHAIAQTVGKP